MAEIEVHYDKGTHTLTVWFGDPNEEVDCDHTDSDVIVMLNDKGKPLGIEVLEYFPDDGPLRGRSTTWTLRSALSGRAPELRASLIRRCMEGTRE